MALKTSEVVVLIGIGPKSALPCLREAQMSMEFVSTTHPLTAWEREHSDVFAAFEPFHSHEFRASIARTPFCAILWRSPAVQKSAENP